MSVSSGLAAFACTAALITVSSFVIGCSGKQSIASKSAAAYAAAVKKGVPVAGGHEHGGHVAGQPADDGDAGSDTAGMHHASMPRVQGAAATVDSKSAPAPPASPSEGHKK